MKFIAEKVNDGLLDLSKVDTATLLQWSLNTDDWRDSDVLGHELIYRKGKKKDD